ncbi:MAG: sigma-70 family RNA polymerase sigma factor [Gemmatimonadetes bacterium]|nr:RNA polymerase sigma factor [Gemmatimonadota bacterium]NIQ58593.1 RNA polymerase sigma factor [Gemmatimonadota bacterium]NIU78783.1 sigma-70 family RNA polymerase sigma factor [Gammaproteobacteria bacterium]NIX47596.1 sigma-70 family RNA polymerase sigma factor [Gemmatimonadota bacterium]NIY11955.1 sigma-70 family RNA polymerase sigma factor [Gemmatimonadota bacterium]
MTEDGEALERAAAGDRGAFEGFVRRHEGAVLRYVRTRTSDPDRAEDALQETFIAAWRSARTFRGAGSARSWLLTIARNAVRRQYRRPAGEPEAFEPLEGVADGAGWGRDPGAAWTSRLAAADLVEKGFARLSSDDREILVLRDLEGFSTEETAATLDLSVAAAKSRLHRARLRFMESVRGLDDGA